MRHLTIVFAAALTACQSVDIEVPPDLPQGAVIVVVQSVEYGSGEATAALADGAAEALPLAVTSQTSGDAGALVPTVPPARDETAATEPGAFEVWRDGVRVLETTNPADVEAVVGGADP